MVIDEDKIKATNRPERKPDEGTVTKGLDLKDDQSMFSWFKLADDAVQTFIVDGKQVSVKFSEIETNYEIFNIQGASAKINIDHFMSLPLKVDAMGDGITKTGTAKTTGDEPDLFMSAWCVNHITANIEEKISRDNFWTMKKFLHAIVFGQDLKLRTSPPKGITKSEMKTIKFSWESHKYTVSMTREAYRALEEKINKTLKKFMKKKDITLLRKAESELVKVLQKSMKLKPGEFSSSKGFGNYFIVMFDAMFPKDFGTDTRIKALKENKEW